MYVLQIDTLMDRQKEGRRTVHMRRPVSNTHTDESMDRHPSLYISLANPSIAPPPVCTLACHTNTERRPRKPGQPQPAHTGQDKKEGLP
mmetsp:Transcript_7323/g.21092  ORF Transcript_7323/g.21092 Transcript_7323/m.21092 type:complete len:89 (+) Transcript_7323:309-575(+)